jgi:hypothetical protein
MNRRRGRGALVLDRRYWRRLMPSFSIEGRSRLSAGPSARTTAAAEFTRRGYVQFGPVLQARAAARLIRALETIRRQGWPEILAFVYDDFWLAHRSPMMRAFLESVLGPACHQSPNVWVHVVDARQDAAGWPPHRDHLDASRITVWVPLTRAAVEDGCISLLPRHLLPRKFARSWRPIRTFTRDDVLRLLHASQALPAAAGSAVCWRSDTLHWGGRRTNAARPRIALSMEFAPGPIPVREIGLPAFRLDDPPPAFETRVHLAARMILLYHRNDPRVAAHVGWASRVVDSHSAT